MTSYLKTIKRILTIILLLTLTSSVGYAQEEINVDVVEAIPLDEVKRQPVEFRIPSEKNFDKYKNQSRFKYVNEEPKKEEPINNDPSWLTKALESVIQFFSTVFGSSLFVMLFVIIVGGLILYLILKYFHFDFKSFLKKNKDLESDIDSYLDDEEIKMSEVDRNINQAIESGNFRLALRLLFLRNLKAMSDKNIIVWTKDKTNHMYTNEIANKDLKRAYQESALVFDYVWYGEMHIDESFFGKIRKNMDAMYDKINSYAS